MCEVDKTPSRENRPCVGLKPTTPHKDAGTRASPTVSIQIAKGARRDATAAAAPPAEPPGIPNEEKGC